MRPIFATEVAGQLFKKDSDSKEEKSDDPFGILKKHYGGLMKVIAEELKVKETDIVDMELNFADT